jgi:hypothetical protein
MGASAKIGGKVDGWPHWTTPKSFLDRVRKVGPIGLDPCGNEASTVGAGTAFHGAMIDADGLAMPWQPYTSGNIHPNGLAFVNPDYSATKAWIAKMIEEARRGVEIITLVPARTSTPWFHAILQSGDAGLLWGPGRIRFENPPPPRCRKCKVSAADEAEVPSRHQICPFGEDGEHAWTEPGKSPSIESFVGYWGPRVDAFFDAFDGAGELLRLKAKR